MIKKIIMKNFIQNNYHKHLFVGLVIGNYLSLILNKMGHSEMTTHTACSLLFGFIAGVIWEGEQTYRYQHVVWDWKDVIYSAVGSLFGSLIITLIF